MLTRIEIHGFKTFEHFDLDVQPFSAIVGPNASGKSNLFDALKFLSLLAANDVRTAMLGLRGEPEELFRHTEAGSFDEMRFGVEVVLNRTGMDSFGTLYHLKAQRLRYEVDLALKKDGRNQPKGIFVTREKCIAIAKADERATDLTKADIAYAGGLKPFLRMEDDGTAFVIRQDGPAGDAGSTKRNRQSASKSGRSETMPTRLERDDSYVSENGPAKGRHQRPSKRGRPLKLPAAEASRTALSTITTAEFPHLYALRDLLSSIRFLEINPQAARKANDRFERGSLRPDASNLAAVLAHLKEDTGTDERPDGVIADISMDLASLIPSAKGVKVFSDGNTKEYSFGIVTSDSLEFSSRVISDGTLRLLALLAVLDDSNRRGILCFEEPENGVHEGRIAALVDFLRAAASTAEAIGQDTLFQILVNTHSPAVMSALKDREIIAADSVIVTDPDQKTKVVKTRMRTGVNPISDLFDPQTVLTRSEVENLLRRQSFGP